MALAALVRLRAVVATALPGYLLLSGLGLAAEAGLGAAAVSAAAAAAAFLSPELDGGCCCCFLEVLAVFNEAGERKKKEKEEGKIGRGGESWRS